MLHSWNGSTDGNGATARVFLFDFKKAFDLIDHCLLVAKLHTYNLPPWVINWIIDFLTCRKQRVKLDQDCFSVWAEIPQGTKLGPWLFLIMINDLSTPDSEIWKFMDDTTVDDIIDKNDVSTIQNTINDLTTQISTEKFQLNETASAKNYVLGLVNQVLILTQLL